MRFLGALSLMVWAGLPVGQLAADEKGFLDRFVDPTDNHLDASEFLESGGFIPLPIIITEPALDQGLGIAAAFLKNPEPGSGEDPTRTFLGYAQTGNDSKFAFAGRFGSLKGGDLKYRAMLAAGSINLDFFPLGIGPGISFNNEATYANLELYHRIRDSRFYFGPTVTLLNTKISPNPSGGGLLPPALARDIKLNALGLGLHFDSRDNPLTPRNGLNAYVDASRYDSAWGSDADYTAGEVFAAWFHSPDARWTMSAMAHGTGTRGNTPFFMEPSINIRGVPFNRYQGDRVISSEIEVRYQVSPRWSVLGFAGYGRSSSTGSTVINHSTSVTAWGGGVRYRIARKFGLDMGLDIAKGSEDTVVYIQFGHAWAMRMD